ncbi:hypothetical protein [Curtobacterium herbarum]|uniref:Uncharacterized protein n=1 Tax=Curtobacterium herbarum TaxID=150122 RepID=A0ABN1Z8U3_9MICO|nr:hypothetical protein [Curtobacterium herbarum]MBM7476381.1 hypothetical protein [Curtobacterium herbarum]MBY0176118.1 hypothetical protein [Curtobacterium herbarum]MCS6544054.1 hypothetical protein [Curtobacterium herbarum]
MKRLTTLSKGVLVVGLGVIAAGSLAPAFTAQASTAPTSVHAEVSHGGGDQGSLGWFIHY